MGHKKKREHNTIVTQHEFVVPAGITCVHEDKTYIHNYHKNSGHYPKSAFCKNKNTVYLAELIFPEPVITPTPAPVEPTNTGSEAPTEPAPSV